MTYYHGADANGAVKGTETSSKQAKSYHTGTDLAERKPIKIMMRTAPASAARAKSAFELLAMAAMPSIRNRAAIMARPRLNPTLLALHMHAAKHPQPRIIDTTNDF